jgi:hypothetical protein
MERVVLGALGRNLVDPAKAAHFAVRFDASTTRDL